LNGEKNQGRFKFHQIIMSWIVKNVFLQVSQFGLWPFMAIINDAQYKIRHWIIVLISIWYPSDNAITNHALKGLSKLEKDGIIVNR
jgi:hypothetical protein